MYVFHILNIELELDPTLIHLALLDSSNKLICSRAFCALPNYTNSEPPLLSPSRSYSESFWYTILFRRVLETRFVTSIRNTLDMTEGRHRAQAEANSRKPPNFQISGYDFRRIQVAWATHNSIFRIKTFMSHAKYCHTTLYSQLTMCRINSYHSQTRSDIHSFCIISICTHVRTIHSESFHKP